MKTIPFTKVVGAGNDFVIMDNRRHQLPRDLPQLARQVCDRQRGIGADGFLVAEATSNGHVRMRIFNPDGTEPEMCGNGARCFALYAVARRLAPHRMRVATQAGVLEAHVLPHGWVRLEMPVPTAFGELSLRVRGRTRHLYRVHIGNPHVVALVPKLDRVDVEGVGRLIRYHPRFAPRGTNVNFVQRQRGVAQLRTYERGVEHETLACGTGATATAAILARYFHQRSPMTVRTRSGDLLRISWQLEGTKMRRMFLEGPARLVFEGTWPRKEQSQ